MTQKMLKFFTLAMVTQCDLNQLEEYGLLFDVIFIAITMWDMMYNTNFNVNDGIHVYGFD
jgi:hypothetical protein